MSAVETTTLLGPGDEPALEAFLVQHADSSVLLRANVRSRGLVDRGQPFDGTYVARRKADGRVVGVVGHAWNGNLLVQAPDAAGPLAVAAATASGRPVRGFLGPRAQVEAARAALGLDGARAEVDDCDDLLAVDLAGLVVPEPLASGAVHCRQPAAGEMDLLVAWRVAFAIEELGAVAGPGLEARVRDEMATFSGSGNGWVAVAGGQPVAFAAWMGCLPDVVQIGGVFTPPALRRHGYARAVVAGALLAARARGVGRGVLFTPPRNAAAQAAYRALGYRRVGDYGLIILATS